MAKMTAGPLAGVVSGKLGTVVFSRGRYGSYMRVRTMPTKVQTAATLEAQGRLSFLSKAWANMDPEEKLAWGTWAQTNPVTDRLGASQVLHAAAAFNQINARILKAGGTAVDLPPVAASPPGLLTASVVSDVSSNTVTIAFTASPLAANNCLAVWAAGIDAPGRENYKSFRKLIAVSAAAQATAYNVETFFEGRFGSKVAGQRIFLDLEVWSKVTGLKSSTLSCSCIVTA